MKFGLPIPIGAPDPKQKPITSFWWHEIVRSDPDLLTPSSRCLIILDSFSFPGGPDGGRTRTCYGFDDRPIFAWAGLWRDSGKARGYAGLLVPAAAPISPGSAMPAIVDPANYSSWLAAKPSPDGVTGFAVAAQALYREESERPWGADRTS